MEKENVFEMLESYRNGSLSAEEKADLEIKIADNPELKRQLELLKSVDDLVIINDLYHVENKIKNWKPGNRGKGWKIYVLSAGIVLFISSILYFYNYKKAPYSTLSETKNRLFIKKNVESLVVSDHDSAYYSEKFLKPTKVYNNKSIDTILFQNNMNNITDTVTLSLKDQVSSNTILSDNNSPVINASNINICNHTVIKYNISVNKTCQGQSDGRIEIFDVLGGEAPFNFQLGENQIQNDPTFQGLSKGNYTIIVSDKNGCKTIKDVFVPDYKCKISEAAFSPTYGQVFIFPLNEQESGEVVIYNSSGIKILEQRIQFSDEWEGKDNNGNFLKTDSYSYIIKLDNGEIRNGNVSIIE